MALAMSAPSSAAGAVVSGLGLSNSRRFRSVFEGEAVGFGNLFFGRRHLFAAKSSCWKLSHIGGGGVRASFDHIPKQFRQENLEDGCTFFNPELITFSRKTCILVDEAVVVCMEYMGTRVCLCHVFPTFAERSSTFHSIRFLPAASAILSWEVLSMASDLSIS